ncbi:hypothetical protein [Streptomyces sp. NEAU-174]|uniref:hypothetical protein n=1 Tax=Streptomyces sp. NEAU-174 TaxID=3458254 RepID=UPI004044909C
MPEWDGAKLPQPSQDLFTASCQLTDEEHEIIQAVVERVKLMAAEKPNILVSLAVGAGDPATAWQNPSLDVDPMVLARQSEPGYFTDAAKNGYFVISIILNRSSFPKEQNFTQTETDSFVQIQAPARFPLNDPPTSKTWAALAELADFVKKKGGLWVVANCLTDHHYQRIMDLVAKGGRVTSAYLHSYALKGHTIERAYNLHGKMCQYKNSHFERLGDVFEQLDTQGLVVLAS